jgi:hypothetical protein
MTLRDLPWLSARERIARRAILLVCAVVLLPYAAVAQAFDVVVYGGTSAGVAAALSAARLGRGVALVEYHPYLGGMMTSGLGKSDVETRDAIGGLFRELVERVGRDYVSRYGADSPNVKASREGYYYEPSVAQRVVDSMVAGEPRIQVFRAHRLEEVVRRGNRVVAIRVTDRATGEVKELRGGVFVDATYEGDLLAFAGARYRLGREGRAEFGEPHAGVIYQDYETRALLAGTTGEGDRRIPAYTFRLCLTDDPANARVLAAPPPDYDRARYTGYIDDWKAGRMAPPKVMKDGVGYFGPTFNTVVRALSFARLPNRKLDVNMNPRPLGFPFAELNAEYPEADWPTRERIVERIRNMTLGLLYFLQNDKAVPLEHRTLARTFNLAKDEFTDTDNFPWQLYVREARRLVGLYTLTELDTRVAAGLERTPIHADSVAAGEFPIDSFPVRAREPGHDVALEGYIFMLDTTRPYQVPYSIMVPETVDALLVPVAASTSHVAFSTIRTEPTWMALGQAAGVAAHLALASNRQPRAVDISDLQRALLRQGQVLTHFEDIDVRDPAHAALQYFGTKGFFTGYQTRSHDVLERTLAAAWLAKVAPHRRLPKSSAAFVTGADMTALFPGLDESWRGPAASRRDPADAVRRGEFCQALYAWLEARR